MKMLDAQAALTFLVQQATYIEPQIDMIEYPTIQYPDLVPVDFSAPPWTKTVTYFSGDMAGKAKWFHAEGRDVPRADVNRTRFETEVHMAAVGYGYNIEDITRAQQAGIPLENEKADSARFAYEEFVDDALLLGDTEKGFSGLINYPGITQGFFAADGTGGSTTLASKTPAQIIRDFNAAMTGIYSSTNQVEMADTVLTAFTHWQYLGITPLNNTSDTSILDYLVNKNIYTLMTGRPLRIVGVRGLETAGRRADAGLSLRSEDPQGAHSNAPPVDRADANRPAHL